MKILRTPDACFDNLVGYPFEPHYLEISDGEGQDGTLRVHYVDEGPRDAASVVFLHGNPTWSYLLRKIIVATGHRTIALDRVGTGRSDKPSETKDYTVARHVEWIRAAIVDALDLHDVSFVLHDWGGIIGLRILGEHPDRIARVCISNTALPVRDPAEPLPPGPHPPSGPLAGFQKMVREAAGRTGRCCAHSRLRTCPKKWSTAFTLPTRSRSTSSATDGSRSSCRPRPTTSCTRPNGEAWQVVQHGELVGEFALSPQREGAGESGVRWPFHACDRPRRSCRSPARPR